MEAEYIIICKERNALKDHQKDLLKDIHILK